MTTEEIARALFEDQERSVRKLEDRVPSRKEPASPAVVGTI